MSPDTPELEFPAAPVADVSQGLVETMLVVDGRPVELARHLGRAAASLHELYAAALPHALAGMIEEAAAGHALARLRVVLDPGALQAPAIAVEPVDRALVLPGEEVALATVTVSGGFGAHKLADRSWLAGIEEAAGEGVRALLATREGALLETTRANVLLIRGGVLATPPLDGTILPGVVRARLLERARHAGLDRGRAATHARGSTRRRCGGAVELRAPARARAPAGRGPQRRGARSAARGARALDGDRLNTLRKRPGSRAPRRW